MKHLISPKKGNTLNPGGQSLLPSFVANMLGLLWNVVFQFSHSLGNALGKFCKGFLASKPLQIYVCAIRGGPARGRQGPAGSNPSSGALFRTPPRPSTRRAQASPRLAAAGHFSPASLGYALEPVAKPFAASPKLLKLKPPAERPASAPPHAKSFAARRRDCVGWQIQASTPYSEFLVAGKRWNFRWLSATPCSGRNKISPPPDYWGQHKCHITITTSAQMPPPPLF